METNIIELANKVAEDAKRILARPEFEPKYITEKAIVCNLMHEFSEHEPSIAPNLLKLYNALEKSANEYHGLNVKEDQIDKEYVQFAFLAAIVHNLPENTLERHLTFRDLLEMMVIMYGEPTS